MFIQTDT